MILLFSSALLSVAAAYVAAAFIPGKTFTHTESVIFLVLLRLCSFFLLCKGVLNGHTIEQKYSIFLCVYDILSVLYLFSWGSLVVPAVQLLIWGDVLQIIIGVIGVIHMRRSLPWRKYKRLLSGEIDMFCHLVKASCDIFCFIFFYASFTYLLSRNPVPMKLFVILLLFLINASFSADYVIGCASVLGMAAFREILYNQNISNISLFLCLLGVVVFLSINMHLKWVPPSNTGTVKRITIEE